MKAAATYGSEYKDFLRTARTERLCAREIERRLREAGFAPIESKKELSSGDRIYRVVKSRTVLAAVVGKRPEKLSIVGSHVDSPKLDLKPQPFLERGNLALMKTHDYGWVKPYQWVNVPLDLIGVIFTRDGAAHEFSIGRSPDDPVFVIPDIPPHIAGEQRKKSMDDGFKASQLNAVCLCGGRTEGAKGILETLRGLLKKNRGVEERDFACADLSLVPHQDPVDVGFDRDLVGSYGHDDRSSVFASLAALEEIRDPERTALGFFVDKEEVASTGDTSAQSFVLRNFVAEYCRRFASSELDPDSLLADAEAVSADVTTGFDPNFPEVFDAGNIALIGGGVAVEKYGAAGSGKFRANEARAEYMQTIRGVLDSNGIPWQTGTLAELGVGGGGTIAAFLSRYGMDCVDAGPCLLGMHSPFEIGSLRDFHSSYRFYRAFFDR